MPKDSEKELKVKTRPCKDGVMVITEKREDDDFDIVCEEVN